jgi:hypothetical protein
MAYRSREYLDCILILSKWHIQRVVRGYQALINRARPHQSIGQSLPSQPELRDEPGLSGKVVSSSVLGALHHDSHRQPPRR